MSRLRIFDESQPQSPLLELQHHASIAAELGKVGVRFEQWAAQQAIAPGASQDEVIAAYRAEIQQRSGIRQAEIVTARELSGAERDELVAGVGKLAGARIEPSFKLDKSILGGTVVRIGSTVYDGSIRGRLERLREAIAGE